MSTQNLQPRQIDIKNLKTEKFLDMLEMSGRVHAISEPEPALRVWTPNEIAQGAYVIENPSREIGHVVFRRAIGFRDGITLLSYRPMGMRIEDEMKVINKILDKIGQATRTGRRNASNFFAGAPIFSNMREIVDGLKDVRIRAKVGGDYVWLREFLNTEITAVAPDFTQGKLYVAGERDGSQHVMEIDGKNARVLQEVKVDHPIISMEFADDRLFFVCYNRSENRTTTFVLNFFDATTEVVESVGNKVVKVEGFKDRIYLYTEEMQLLELDPETLEVTIVEIADGCQPLQGFTNGRPVHSEDDDLFTIGEQIRPVG
jgi:hypothetical protein